MVQCLTQFATIESPSHDAASQVAIFDFLAQRFTGIGYKCERYKGVESGGQLLATPASLDPNEPQQLLLGHCDTVWPLGTLKTMPVEVRDGCLHGPGVYDMKGGLVQAIFALAALKELGLQPTVSPIFFINSDEEIGSGESVDQICRLAKSVDRVMVMEPSLEPGGRLKTSRKGVGRFYMTAIGKASHAGLDPDKGISAVLEMSHVIRLLFEMNDPSRGVSVNVGRVEGGTQPNVIAAECRAEVDVRVRTQQDAEEIQRQILSIQPTVKGATLDIRGEIGRPPMESTPGNRKLWKLAAGAADAIGIAIDEGAAGGGSDGNWTSLSAPTLDGLGAVGDGAHALHEHVVIEKMAERSALLACLISEPMMR